MHDQNTVQTDDKINNLNASINSFIHTSPDKPRVPM